MLLASGAALFAGPVEGGERDQLRGTLRADSQGHPLLTLPGGAAIRLEAGADTLAILTDSRLLNNDLEVFGKRVNAKSFRVDPIHTASLFVYQDGRKWRITYWCDVCHLRTGTPGKCASCQKETDLDLRDPDEK